MILVHPAGYGVTLNDAGGDGSEVLPYPAATESSATPTRLQVYECRRDVTTISSRELTALLDVRRVQQRGLIFDTCGAAGVLEDLTRSLDISSGQVRVLACLEARRSFR